MSKERRQLLDLTDGADLGVHVLAGTAHGQAGVVVVGCGVADEDAEVVGVD